MPHIVFVAPRFLENTNRYVAAFANLDGLTLSVISEDPERAIPRGLRSRIAGHYRISNVLDETQLIQAVSAIERGVGPVDRLTGALEQLQMPMAETRDALKIEGVSAAVARNFRDKDRMKEVLRAHDVPVARSALIHSSDELKRFIDRVGYPIIVKPQAGLGARSTYRITSVDDIRALERTGQNPTPARPLQAEEFIRAREYTCETVTIRGEAVWRSGTRYLPSPLEVLESPWIQYCVLLPREDDNPEWTAFHPTNDAALKALLGNAASTAAGTALTHMEWFREDGGRSLVNEVGIRPPGVCIMPLMSLAHETNFIADWAELIAFDRFTPKKRTFAAGAAFLRGHGHGSRIVRVDGLDRAIATVGDALMELRAPQVGQVRSESYEGEGWATVRHPTTDGVKRALLTLIETIQITYG